MQSSNIPTKLPIPFGNAAGGGYIRPIPVASQIGVLDGAASLTDGFPPLNATPIGAGGIPPDIKDMNGILFEVSGWARWIAAGASAFFDGTFSTAIGGYPKGAFLYSATTPGRFYVSTIEDNTNNPDSVLTGWIVVVPVKASTGEIATGTDDAKFVTAAGLASLRASNAETLAGTSAIKYVTPAGLFDVRASAADVQAGTSTHRYVTPAALVGAGDANFGFDGEYVWPGGFKMTWRHLTANPGATSGSWTIPFASQCVAAWLNGGNSLGDDQDNNPIVAAYTASGFTINSARDNSVSVVVIGIGK